MKIAPARCLDKEGQAAASGCWRGGSKVGRVSEIEGLGLSPQPACRALGTASPPPLRREPIFRKGVRPMKRYLFLLGFALEFGAIAVASFALVSLSAAQVSNAVSTPLPSSDQKPMKIDSASEAIASATFIGPSF